MAATGTETATTTAAAALQQWQSGSRHDTSRANGMFFFKFCFLYITLSFLGYLNTLKRPWQIKYIGPTK